MTGCVKTPALDPAAVTPRKGSSYPAPFAPPCVEREKRALGDPLGLTQFGVNLTTLPPGAWSAQRHWHQHEDEFVYVLEGEVVLITDAGEQVLTPGMAAGFPAGKEDGHHLVNRSDRPTRFLEVGTRAPQEQAVYPDIDMTVEMSERRFVFSHKDGTPY
jgi:uncharacterized cupin superfamily protein